MFQKFIKYPAVFAVLILAFSLAIVLVNAIPVSFLSNNLHESADILLKQGDNFNLLENKTTYGTVDNYTNARMLNIAGHNSDMGLKGAFGAYYSRISDTEPNEVVNFAETIDTSVLENPLAIQYTRYWHGWKVWLKPLLLFFNISQIQFIVFILMSALIFIAATMLARLRSCAAGVIFGASYAIVLYPIACMSLSFASSFLLSILMSIRVLYVFGKHKRQAKSQVVKKHPRARTLSLSRKRPAPKWGWQIEFFVVGCLTAYFDFLCNPIITLAVPLALLMFLQGKVSLSKNLKLLVGCAILWGLGYGLAWAIKWPIAQIVTGEPAIADGLGEILFQSGSRQNQVSNEASKLSRTNILAKQIQMMFPSKIFAVLAVVAIVFVVAYIAVRKRNQLKQAIPRVVPLLLLALLPYVWYIFALKHSNEHYWFTYRNQLVTVLALGLSVLLVLRRQARPKPNKRNW